MLRGVTVAKLDLSLEKWLTYGAAGPFSLFLIQRPVEKYPGLRSRAGLWTTTVFKGLFGVFGTASGFLGVLATRSAPKNLDCIDGLVGRGCAR